MPQETRSVSPWSRLLIGLAGAFTVLVLGGWMANAAETDGCPKAKARVKKPAASAPAKIDAAEPAATAPAEAAGQAGMKAFIDPVTGQLREPTPEEAAAVVRGKGRETLRAVPEPVVVQHANGISSAQLGDEYMNDVVVGKRPDGTLVFRCVPRSQSDKALTKPAPPAKPELEKE